MKKLFSIMLALLLAAGIVTAQQATKKKGQLQKEKASERERSLGGQRKGSEGIGAPPVDTNQQDDDQQQNNDQGEQNSSVITPNKDQNPEAADEAENNNSQATKREKSNAPAVVQITSSESGSPAILSPDNGRGRDGTNNVQRSTYNMAGAEVPGGMNLSKKNSGGRNVNMGNSRIRKQEEQPVRTAISGTEKMSPAKEVVEQPKTKSGQDKKSKRKNRKNKGKDSGE